MLSIPSLATFCVVTLHPETGKGVSVVVMIHMPLYAPSLQNTI